MKETATRCHGDFATYFRRFLSSGSWLLSGLLLVQTGWVDCYSSCDLTNIETASCSRHVIYLLHVMGKEHWNADRQVFWIVNGIWSCLYKSTQWSWLKRWAAVARFVWGVCLKLVLICKGYCNSLTAWLCRGYCNWGIMGSCSPTSKDSSGFEPMTSAELL
jgi:hypothetical protein